MRKPNASLLSKLSLLIPENDYHAVMHDHAGNTSYYEHYHDYYEITFYLGDREAPYRTESGVYTVRKGDVIFCRMFETHIMDCAENEGHMRFCMGIEPRILGDYSKKSANLYRLFSEQNPQYPILHLDMLSFQKYPHMIQEFQQLGNSPGEEIIANSIIHRILGSLYCDLALEPVQEIARLRQIQVVGSILHDIEENLATPISLKDIAGKYNYSVTYVCKLFKSVTGTPLVSYVIEKRIGRARQLMYQNLDIVEIAEQVGYHNYSNFYKGFKKIVGMSPEEYRSHIAEGKQ